MIFQKKILDTYKNMIFSRCDNKGTAFYFSSQDFDGLEAEKYTVRSSLGHDLQGYIYSYSNPTSDRLIIFEHGLGGGHSSYMREIETLCRHGFLVLSYDHTGCMESGGESTNGLSQSLRDLNDVLTTVSSDEKFKGIDISVIGHSWGAFSTMNIASLFPNVSHLVAISGFISVEKMVSSMFGGMLKPYRSSVMKLERSANPDFVKFDAINSLKTANAKTLLIYSDNDPLCKKSAHYDILTKELADKKNIKILLESNKGHNPNYTESAVAYLGEYTQKLQEMNKKGLLSTAEQRAEFVSSFDWRAMTEQDARVWNEIFECLDS